MNKLQKFDEFSFIIPLCLKKSQPKMFPYLFSNLRSPFRELLTLINFVPIVYCKCSRILESTKISTVKIIFGFVNICYAQVIFLQRYYLQQAFRETERRRSLERERNFENYLVVTVLFFLVYLGDLRARTSSAGGLYSFRLNINRNVSKLQIRLQYSYEKNKFGPCLWYA